MRKPTGRKLTRKTHKHTGETITRLPTGRFQIRIKDAAGKPYRPSYETLDEAKAALNEFRDRQARGERFLVSATHTTFSEACELRVKQLIHTGRAKATIDQATGTHRRHFVPTFGAKRLSWFLDDRMQSVKDWFAEKKTEGYAADVLSGFRKEFKLAFDAAISEGKMAPPNPMVAFGVSIPHVATKRREVLTIKDMSALVGAAVSRWPNQHELVSHARFVMIILGLSVPLRDQDLCGLCWDCVDLEGRHFYLHRTVVMVGCQERPATRGRHPTTNQEWVLVDSTKTGESGKGECHMSPVAHAVLTAWRDRLRERGFPTSGRVPVLRTNNTEKLTTNNIVGTHIPALMRKADLIENKGNRYSWYNLRHTVPSMWRAIGMDLDEIKDRMRHTQLETTERYRHRNPEYVKILRPQVEDVIEELGLDRTPEGLIDALSLVLARTWRRLAIEVPCSPPSTQRQRRLPNYRTGGDEPAAINGTVIEMTPDAVTTAEPVPEPTRQLLLSPWKLVELRCDEARRLSDPPHNWSLERIAQYLGVARKTVRRYIDNPGKPINMRKLRRDELTEIQSQIGQLLDEGMNVPTISAALNIRKQAVHGFAEQRGKRIKYYRPALKLGQHEEQVRKWNAEGVTNYEIGKRLGFGSTTIDAFVKRLGLRAAGQHGRRSKSAQPVDAGVRQ